MSACLVNGKWERQYTERYRDFSNNLRERTVWAGTVSEAFKKFMVDGYSNGWMWSEITTTVSGELIYRWEAGKNKNTDGACTPVAGSMAAGGVKP